jgi:hypothetical protein
MPSNLTRPDSYIYNYSGIIPFNDPREVSNGPFRAVYVAAGAHKNLRLVVGDPWLPAGHKDSYSLDRIGKVIVKTFEKCWIVNSVGDLASTVPLELHFHRTSVGIIQSERDHSRTSKIIQNREDQAVPNNTLTTIGQYFTTKAPFEDSQYDAEDVFWAGSVRSPVAFQVQWFEVMNAAANKVNLIGAMDSRTVGTYSYLYLDSGYWDFKWDGSSALAVPVIGRRVPLSPTYRHILRLIQTSGGEENISWITATVNR